MLWLTGKWAGPDMQPPSGKAMEDGLLYVRQKMFVRVCNKNLVANYRKKIKRAQKVKKDMSGDAYKPPSPVTEEDMPENWFFNGYFAFVLYGPSGLTGKTFSCLMVSDKNVDRVSRKKTRENNSEVKNKERERGVGGERGMTNSEHLAFASLAHSQTCDDARDIREHLIIANADETNALKKMELLERMMDRAI
jgi:hypothetical protein